MASAEFVSSFLVSRLCDLVHATPSSPLPFFGVPGDYSFGMLDAILSNPSARWLGCSSELNAGYAADGYARIKGIAVLVTTYGVGELSAMNAVAGAYCERSPVVVLTSTPSAAEAKLGRILHHSLNHGEEHGGIDVFARLHASITAAAARLTPDNARTETERVLSELFRTSCPVYISVPADVQTKPIHDPGPPSSLVAVSTPPSDPAALAACLQAVAAAVNAAQRPCILASSGVLRASCVAELAQLVTTANLPAAVLVMGRGCLDESDPHVVGVYQGASPGEIIAPPVTQRPPPPGKYSCPSAVQGLVESSDCVLSIGANFTDWTTGSFTGHVDDQNIVDVKINRTVVKGAETFHNVRSRDLLAALASAIRPRRAGEDAYWARRADGDGILRSPAAGPGAPLTTDAILAALQSELRSGDVICFDTCTAGFGWASARLPKGVTVLNQMIYGSIGFATPAASGVAFALEGQPGRRTILVTGDGSLQMTATHIGTMLQARQPVLIVVINNAGYLIEKLLSRRRQASYNDIAPWRYTLLPSAFGAAPDSFFSHSVDSSAELTSALKAALQAQAQGKLALLECITPELDVPFGSAHIIPSKFVD